MQACGVNGAPLTRLRAFAAFCRELDLMLPNGRGCLLAGMAFAGCSCAAVQLCIIVGCFKD